MDKEYLYVGHYTDTNGKYILKIGTTNNLERRAKEHTRNYRKAKTHTMPKKQQFEYNWYLPLSKYNTLRYEDSNREKWIAQGIGEFIRNDRFVCEEKPVQVLIQIKKEYVVSL